MATDFNGLVPTSVVGELIAALEEQSVTMQLGRVIRMTTGQAAVPVSKTPHKNAAITCIAAPTLPAVSLVGVRWGPRQRRSRRYDAPSRSSAAMRPAARYPRIAGGEHIRAIAKRETTAAVAAGSTSIAAISALPASVRARRQRVRG